MEKGRIAIEEHIRGRVEAAGRREAIAIGTVGNVKCPQLSRGS
jgi:hypothetical protein